MNCMDGCRFAVWRKTVDGRLHPTGDGYCKWRMPKIDLPVSFYYLGIVGMPEPVGGYINRKHLKDCPTWEKAKTDNVNT